MGGVWLWVLLVDCLGALLWLCGLCFGGVWLCLALGVRACCGAFIDAMVNHHVALCFGLLFHIDWRVPALALDALGVLACCGACSGLLWGLLWLALGLALACSGACSGLLWGLLWLAVCGVLGCVVLGVGCLGCLVLGAWGWLWLLPLGGKGAQRQGRAFFCLHRGLGWGSAVLLCPSGWLVVACVFRFFPCPSGLGRKNTFIVV